MVDIVDIALCVCKLLLYNNFKRGVMSHEYDLAPFPLEKIIFSRKYCIMIET